MRVGEIWTCIKPVGTQINTSDKFKIVNFENCKFTRKHGVIFEHKDCVGIKRIKDKNNFHFIRKFFLEHFQKIS
jgi:hypothetical protein